MTPKKRGKKSNEEIGSFVASALKCFQELETLEDLPIGQLSAIQTLARTEFRVAMFSTAFAIRNELERALMSLKRNLGGISGYERELKLLEALMNGDSVSSISKEMGLSREHVARHIQPRAIKILTRAFLSGLQDRHTSVEHR